MHASNPETIYSAGYGDWTQARLITVSGSARTVPMSHRDNQCRLRSFIILEQTGMENLRVTWLMQIQQVPCRHCVLYKFTYLKLFS